MTKAELKYAEEKCLTLLPRPPAVPLEWNGEPDFQMGFEWLGRSVIPAQEMSRHWLILGETGSGKTRSAVMPLLHALLRYGH